MSRFLNTRGRSTLTIALCDRCRMKFPINKLMSDPNAPGLRVCEADLDDLDPYRLPPRQPEDITPRFVRKDVDITLNGSGDPVTPDPGDGSTPPTGGDVTPDALLDDGGNSFELDQGALG